MSLKRWSLKFALICRTRARMAVSSAGEIWAVARRAVSRAASSRIDTLMAEKVVGSLANLAPLRRGPVVKIRHSAGRRWALAAGRQQVGVRRFGGQQLRGRGAGKLAEAAHKVAVIVV